DTLVKPSRGHPDGRSGERHRDRLGRGPRFCDQESAGSRPTIPGPPATGQAAIARVSGYGALTAGPDSAAEVDGSWSGRQDHLGATMGLEVVPDAQRYVIPLIPGKVQRDLRRHRHLYRDGRGPLIGGDGVAVEEVPPRIAGSSEVDHGTSRKLASSRDVDGDDVERKSVVSCAH